jgi:hypothetical protein
LDQDQHRLLEQQVLLAHLVALPEPRAQLALAQLEPLVLLELMAQLGLQEYREAQELLVSLELTEQLVALVQLVYLEVMELQARLEPLAWMAQLERLD